MDTLREVDDALPEALTTPTKPADEKSSTGSPSTQEAILAAQKQGWSERTPYDYAEYADYKSADWAGIAARYEWDDEYGDVGPANEELEKMLFNNAFIVRAGQALADLNETPRIFCESKEEINPVLNWDDAGLHPVMRQNIKLCLYDKPTPVQSYAIPAIFQNKDLIGIAQTGSGKTGAFLIPILSKLMGKAKKLAAARPNVARGFDPRLNGVRAEPLVLVVCPTRELATQIFDESRRLCYRSMLRPCVAYGGAPSRQQREELQKGCDILIGTPGRVLQFMSEPHILSLRRVKYTVIDEADELLQFDWQEDFKKIMSGGDINEDDDHRYLMFSATFNKECRKLARSYLNEDYVRIRIGRPGSSHLNVYQRVVYAEESRKNQALLDLLMSNVPIRTLIFVNNKNDVDRVDDLLYNSNLPSTSMHSGRTQREREDAIRSFKTARCPIMVATGVSARGLDIINVMHVINYDLPRANHGGITEYVHRIGRTARIGNRGIATSFYNDEKDEELAPDLVKILLECNQEIPDFLQRFEPPDSILEFNDDVTDEEDETDTEAQDDPIAESKNDLLGLDDTAEVAEKSEVASSGKALEITDENDSGTMSASQWAPPSGW